MSWDKLDAQEANAKKVLGDGATFPKQKVDIQALVDKWRAAIDKFKTSRDELEKLLEAVEDAQDAFKNGVKTVAAAYEVDDFGLDESNKNDAKKIKDAQKIFSSFFSRQVALLVDTDKKLDELQKHLEQLTKYKGPPK